jgi:hypothetical protein
MIRAESFIAALQHAWSADGGLRAVILDYMAG